MENKKPTRQYKKRKVESSEEAIELFGDEDAPVLVAEEEKFKLSTDVDDLFSDFKDDEDLRTGRSEGTPFEYAKSPKTTYDEELEAHNKDMIPGSPKVRGSILDDIIRAEELAADLVRTRGRFIEGSDDAKIGVPFRAEESDVYAPDMPLPYADQPSIKSDGISFDNIGILDTGYGAQTKEDVIKPGDRDDPASPHFMVCLNKNCRYREGCMRYRMSNKRNMKSVFYPEDCRRDGIYINVETSNYEAYDPFEVLESTSTPSF